MAVSEFRITRPRAYNTYIRKCQDFNLHTGPSVCWLLVCDHLPLFFSVSNKTDGGGVRGVSELIILKELMHQIQRQNGLTILPKPCQTFDMMGGTSTGGLVAIMLGRLQMTVDQAIEEYLILSKIVFGKKKFSFMPEGKFKAKNLERAIQSVVQRYAPEGQAHPNAPLLKPDLERGDCKVFVCSQNEMRLKSVRLLRSYNGYSAGDYTEATIWQAARATSAAPTFFKPLMMGPPGMEEKFVDGAVGYNNPTRELLNEAARIFAPEHPVACIISVGTGLKHLTKKKVPGFLQSNIPVDAIKAMITMATDCEQTAESMRQHFAYIPDLYFRFNVIHGIGTIGLDEWKQVPYIIRETKEYSSSPGVNEQLSRAAWALWGGSGRCTVSRLVC